MSTRNRAQKKSLHAREPCRASLGFRILSSLSFFICKMGTGKSSVERENECAKTFLACGGLSLGMAWSFHPIYVFPFIEHFAPTVPLIWGSKFSVDSR